ncbi:uncharacterized protein BKA55DRAFT_629165 [Fusarium redolens]|uniref:Phytanoyl-CoA dioxygenase n=1 Tax=Fusarium redolens TaxID=48865 RepID=A0A9P9JSN6_FUSRE|nr:uncharacterized protein BKA55DRAFT_629165 [Fusarium redolens]KAH7205116.1 hypothetical protein BKA55DRAFT_629165 [Fusarium redolens]
MSYRPEEPGNNSIINSDVGTYAKLFNKKVDPHNEDLIHSVIENGFVILENMFTEAEVEEACQELKRLSESDAAGPASSGGRNKFEGFRTNRIYALLNKSRVFDKFVAHPKIVALNDYFFDPGWLVSTFQSITLQSGAEAQTLHHDDGYITVPRPHRPFGSAIMISLDAYTEFNGSTVVVPKSHEWGPDRIPSRAEALPVVMPRGSIVFFLGTLWHGGGQNTSDHERRALTVQYCQPWVRPIENQILAVNFGRLPEIPKHIVDMMGYQVGKPFIGFVNGESPLKAAQRHLKRWKESNVISSKL